MINKVMALLERLKVFLGFALHVVQAVAAAMVTLLESQGFTVVDDMA